MRPETLTMVRTTDRRTSAHPSRSERRGRVVRKMQRKARATFRYNSIEMISSVSQAA